MIWTSKSEVLKMIHFLNSRQLHYFLQLMSKIRKYDILLIRAHNFCLHLPLWTRKALLLPISTLDESHAELVDAHLPYGGSQERINHVRASICQTTVWRMRGTCLCPECCLMNCVSSGWPTPCQYGWLDTLFNLWFWPAAWTFGVFPSAEQATVNTVTSLDFAACLSIRKSLWC